MYGTPVDFKVVLQCQCYKMDFKKLQRLVGDLKKDINQKIDDSTARLERSFSTQISDLQKEILTLRKLTLKESADPNKNMKLPDVVSLS